jgi:hypothetical protein
VYRERRSVPTFWIFFGSDERAGQGIPLAMRSTELERLLLLNAEYACYGRRDAACSTAIPKAESDGLIKISLSIWIVGITRLPLFKSAR